MHKTHFFRASKNTNSVFSATKQIIENSEATNASKNIFLSEKRLLNAILRAKLKYMNFFSFLMNEQFFCNCRGQISCVLAFLQKKSF